MEELIVKKAKDLFFSYGLKGVSMDDIAKHAGVSKKTIYKSFEDKNQLVQRLVSDLLRCYEQAIEQCKTEANDAIDEVILFTQIPFNTVAVINACFFYELEKFFPSVYELIVEYRQKVLIPTVIANLKKGIDEAVYRPNLDLPFIADVRIQQVLTALNPKTFTSRQQQGNTLILQLSELYLHAIATEKGKKLINKYLNVNNENQFSN